MCSLTYSTCKAHAQYIIVIFGLSPSTIFFDIRPYLINGTIFGKTLSSIKCAFGFSLQLIPETFVIVRRIKPYILLTPWSRVLPEKLKRPELLKKFPAFYGT
jgi:hypothetical protein